MVSTELLDHAYYITLTLKFQEGTIVLPLKPSLTQTTLLTLFSNFLFSWRATATLVSGPRQTTVTLWGNLLQMRDKQWAGAATPERVFRMTGTSNRPMRDKIRRVSLYALVSDTSLFPVTVTQRTEEDSRRNRIGWRSRGVVLQSITT